MSNATPTCVRCAERPIREYCWYCPDCIQVLQADDPKVPLGPTFKRTETWADLTGNPGWWRWKFLPGWCAPQKRSGKNKAKAAVQGVKQVLVQGWFMKHADQAAKQSLQEVVKKVKADCGITVKADIVSEIAEKLGIALESACQSPQGAPSAV